ncbi:type IV pilus biogenesis/stability protein PilW [Chitinilyticum litopenaei]|uniref:type IV pilus biogenesis/stability protein PilW n=1 Tax=Chitinilyticum litopenaei TaxID=1121276 RepID=UPI00040FFA75|nr:type IV pilus biogenesis/stability protein PilW [Chitinilyticum litopenaei]
MIRKFMLVALGALLSLLGAQANQGQTGEERSRIRTELAAEYYRRGQYPIAIDEAKKALAADPKNVGAHLMIALSFAELRDDGMAVNSFQQALGIAPADPDVNHNYGWFLCSRSDYAAGLKRLEQVFPQTTYPRIDNTYVVAADCASKAGDPNAAIAYLRMALQYRPANVAARFRLATQLLQAGQIQEARNAYLGLTRLVEPAPADLLWLGVRIERKAGNRAEEKKLSSQLLAQFPDSKEAGQLKAANYD